VWKGKTPAACQEKATRLWSEIAMCDRKPHSGRSSASNYHSGADSAPKGEMRKTGIRRKYPRNVQCNLNAYRSGREVKTNCQSSYRLGTLLIDGIQSTSGVSTARTEKLRGNSARSRKTK
jgi:hypothetical protein